MYETIDTSKGIDTFQTLGALFSLFHISLGEFEVIKSEYVPTHSVHRLTSNCVYLIY